MNLQFLIISLFTIIVSINNCNSEDIDNSKYKLFETLLLSIKVDGIDGKIELWLDKNIRSDIRNFNYIDDSTKGCNAILKIIDNRNKDILTFPLKGVSAAWFEKNVCLPSHPCWRAITINDYAGWGSYSGNYTMYFSVKNDKIEWLRDQNTGEEIKLLKSLKSDWSISKRDKNTILCIHCRSSFGMKKDDTTDQFQITYIRYRWNTNAFYSIKRTDYGFWENEDTFPDEDSFPK